MLSNVALNVAIGLTFVFLLYSLLATIISEFIAHFLNLRPKMLFKGIRRMLEDSTKGRELVNLFYSHPNIKYLAENKYYNKPSYLKKETFTQTVIYLLRGDNFDSSQNQMAEIKKTLDTNPGNVIPKDTLQLLKDMYADAQGDIDRFRYRLDHWFDETMQRTSGWYKRQTQWILLIIGFVLAIIGNIDTIRIYDILSSNEKLSEQFANIAIQSQGKYAAAVDEIRQSERVTYEMITPDSTLKVQTKIITTGDSVLDQAYKMTLDDIKKSSSVLGLGWRTDSCRKCDSLAAILKQKKNTLAATSDTIFQEQLRKDTAVLAQQIQKLDKENECGIGGSLSRFIAALFSRAFLGWLITALAISLGAPFWFDLLNKFINMRAAGTKPKAMAETDPKDSSAASKATTPTPIQRKG